VSSFGFCGVIAHAVVEAAHAIAQPPVASPSPLRFVRRSYPWEPLL